MGKQLKSLLKTSCLLGVEFVMTLMWMAMGVFILKSGNIIAGVFSLFLSYLRFIYCMTYFNRVRKMIKDAQEVLKNKEKY